MNEFDLIQRFFTRPVQGVELGVGDDAAIIRPGIGHDLHVSTDMLVEGRHFFPDVDPFALGHKTLAVNLSDMAAMGARPRWALLSLALPAVDPEWLGAFARGFFALADLHGVALVGGDTTRGPLTLSVTIVGEAPAGRALRRDAAQVGDDVWVSGELGAAALAVQHRLNGDQGLTEAALEACRRRLDYPQPRVALGALLLDCAHAAVDVSDGLAADLGHVLERSALGAEIWFDAIPSPACLGVKRRPYLDALLSGGDDYELCFTAASSERAAISSLASAAGCRLSRIGRTVAEPGLRLLDADGNTLPLRSHGFDHFQD
ncbi:thiamine-phosphate kinase [Paludibacterium yongneupense]|uniref:thiamine-phosphate kinase n=1 Tax=Paludibacterium yongneupense TaxID=400061 RepID=UPI00048F023A|nr:thiamine-phosphate kinase [Paludibacterium yongneupense]